MAIHQTPRGYHYPDDQERVGQFHAHIEQLAEDVDALAGHIQSGTETIQTTPGQNGPFAVTFPEPFQGIPIVIPALQVTNPTSLQVSLHGRTSTGFNLYFWRASGSGGIAIMWIAVG